MLLKMYIGIIPIDNSSTAYNPYIWYNLQALIKLAAVADVQLLS
jgi:IMP cyclohydrolase